MNYVSAVAKKTSDAAIDEEKIHNFAQKISIILIMRQKNNSLGFVVLSSIVR